MPVIITKTQNPQKIMLSLTERDAVFPQEMNSFSSSAEALTSGFFIAAEILNSTLNKIDAVQAIQHKGIDCLAITLKEGQTWEDPIRGMKRLDFLKQKVEEILLSKENEIYLSIAQRTPIPSQEIIDAYIASPPEESVLHKIKEHGGVRAIADTKNNILTWIFRGACASSQCFEKSPRSTHSTLLTETRDAFGDIIQEIKNEAPSLNA